MAQLPGRNRTGQTERRFEIVMNKLLEDTKPIVKLQEQEPQTAWIVSLHLTAISTGSTSQDTIARRTTRFFN
jgi:hypothetical protein